LKLSSRWASLRYIQYLLYTCGPENEPEAYDFLYKSVCSYSYGKITEKSRDAFTANKRLIVKQLTGLSYIRSFIAKHGTIAQHLIRITPHMKSDGILSSNTSSLGIMNTRCVGLSLEKILMMTKSNCFLQLGGIWLLKSPFS
jgi:hypothetical protein